MKAAIRHRLPLEVTVVSLMTAITLAVIALIAAHLLSYRHDLLDNAERGAANLASAFEEHLTVSVGLLDDTLLAARTQPAVRTSQGLRDALKVRPGLNDIALQVSVADRSGQMIASNFDMNGPISIADRPHFRHFSDGNSDDLFISEPVFGRVSQRWTIQVVRRLADASGHFDGVIVISLPPEYLIRFYNTIDVGPRGMVSVIGLDGIVRAQVVASDASFGQALTDSPLVAAARGEMAGSIRSPGPGDAVPRLISFKRVRGHPLFIAVGLAEQDVLSDFRAQLRLWLAIATGGLVSLGIAGTITLRQLRAQRTYEMEIARHRRELEQRVAQRTQRLTLEIERRRESEQALTESIEAMKQAQGEALRASRMASVGQLAAGIAHEINTPVQYIGDNLRFIGVRLRRGRQRIEAGLSQDRTAVRRRRIARGSHSDRPHRPVDARLLPCRRQGQNPGGSQCRHRDHAYGDAQPVEGDCRNGHHPGPRPAAGAVPAGGNEPGVVAPHRQCRPGHREQRQAAAGSDPHRDLGGRHLRLHSRQ